MVETRSKPNEWGRITISVNPELMRAVAEMTLNAREFSRSKIVREAIIEKADRDLPANWRDMVNEESAA